MVDSVSSSSSNASTSSANASSQLSVSGLASGIDSKAIVDALINADSGQKRVLTYKSSILDARTTAVKSLNTKLLSASIDLSRLKLSSTFGARSATTNQTDSVTATANSSAQPGAYEFTVLNTAKAHQKATVGQSSNTIGLGAGTITLQLGSGATKSVTIDGSASSLNDIASAINAAGAGISATVVSQGGVNPYKLVLQGQKTGASNTILATATGALTGLFSAATTITNPDDARIQIGTDAPIVATSESNTATGVIPGVTLNLLKASAGAVKVTVAQDSAAVVTAVKTFVESTNAAITYLNDNAKFDATTGKGGILIGESAIRSNVSSMVRALTNTVSAAGQSASSLAAVGITIDKTTGTLVLEESKLKDKLEENPEAVNKLFTNSGTSSVNSVKFAALTAKTKVTSPFTVVVTQAAAQAVAPTAADLVDGTVINASNNVLNVVINGTEYSATLNSGTYTTKEDLATEIGRTLSGLVSQGDQVSVGIDGARLAIRSKFYGQSQSIQVLPSSTAAAVLGLNPVIARGTDVAGTINGATARGAGQVMSGAAGTDSDGLALLVTATAPVASATVTASKGVAQLADEQIKGLTDPDRGVLPGKINGMEKNITDMTAAIARQDAMLAKRRKLYEARFLAMEKTISQLNSQSSYLSKFSTISNSSK
jgi:flagellar hook-associated protein 2